MQLSKKINHFLFNINLIDLFLIEIISISAIVWQLIYNELPCPLCLLQRIAILSLGYLYILNIKFKPSVIIYVFIIFTAILTTSMSTRQILLHIIPGSKSYGSAILGYHLYTWVFIFSVITILWTLLKLAIFSLYNRMTPIVHSNLVKVFIRTLIFIYFFIIIINMLLVLFECGLNFSCPANPDKYLLNFFN